MPIALTTLAGIISGLFTSSNTTIGPYTIGSTIARNGVNYIVTTGDDFTGSLDLLDAGTPNGKYVPTRTYMSTAAGNGPRGNTSGNLSLLGYDASPGHTGFNDANRGVPVASYSDSIVQSGGFLTLKSRTATTAERNLSAVNTLPDLSAMISTATAFSFMAPFAIEDRYARLKSATNMRGWHDTFWLFQMGPAPVFTGTEIDWEATSLAIAPNRVYWTAGSSTNTPGTDQPDTGDGTFYRRMISVDGTGTITHYQNDAVVKSATPTAPLAVDTTRPFYAMLTNHIADFTADPYTDADWVAAGAAGATSIHDYLMVATATGTVYKPLVTVPPINVDFGVAMTPTVLPTNVALWGSNVTENLESFATESNEPGGNYNGGYRGLAPGLTYTAGTFTLSGTITSRPGRITIQRYTTMPGTACIHSRITVNVGPNITITSLPAATKNVAYSYDLYAACDCGVLVCNAAGQKTKTITVTGLPAGITYNDTTGMVTGTTTVDFNKSLTVTVTNSVGQSVTSLVDFTTAAAIVGNTGVAAPVIQGAPVLRNSWDFDNPALVTVDASTPPIISSVAGADGMALALANATPATSPTRVARTSGRMSAHFTRTAAQFLQATGLSLTAGGSQVIIYEPATVGNSQVIWERSNGTSSTTQNREDLIGIASNGVSARQSDSSGATVDASTITARNTAALSVAVIVFGPSSVTMYFNGTATAITSATAALPTGLNSITLGSRYAASALTLPFDGYVLRVLDYSTVFSAAQAEEAAVWARANYATTNLA